MQQQRTPVEPPVAACDHCSSEHEEGGRDDRAAQRAAHDVRQPTPNGEERDDQLRGVAEARIQEAADAGARVLRHVLRRLADQECERCESARGEDEARCTLDPECVVRDERDGRERERYPEDRPPHLGYLRGLNDACVSDQRRRRTWRQSHHVLTVGADKRRALVP